MKRQRKDKENRKMSRRKVKDRSTVGKMEKEKKHREANSREYG